jgi:hypothetical protein
MSLSSNHQIDHIRDCNSCKAASSSGCRWDGSKCKSKNEMKTNVAIDPPCGTAGSDIAFDYPCHTITDCNECEENPMCVYCSYTDGKVKYWVNIILTTN